MIKKMIVTLTAMAMILSGIVFAGETTKGKPQGTRPPGPNGAFLPGPPKGHPGDLGKYLNDNMLTQALSELTGQSADAIKTALTTQRPDAILETYGVDFETFRTLMDEKTVAMAEKVAGCALITQEQAAEIAENIAARATESDEVTVEDRQTSRPSHSRPPKGHPGELGKYLHDNMFTEALSELTGQSADAIKTALTTQRPDAILETYGIDFETFRTLMDQKSVAMAEKAAECGLITQEQAAEIAENIAARAAESETETAN
jgi:quinolinate synthase